MSSTYPYRRGFTLIEVLVVIALSTVVMTALTNMLIFFYRTNASVMAQTQAVHQARHALDEITLSLRSALYSGDGSSAFTSVATSSLSLYEDANNDGVTETTTISLANGALTKTSTVNGQAGTTRLLADSVQNDASTPLFTYYDAQGNVLADPVDVTKIAAVSMQIVIDVDQNRDPAPFTLTGLATLRNAKSRL